MEIFKMIKIPIVKNALWQRIIIYLIKEDITNITNEKEQVKINYNKYTLVKRSNSKRDAI